MRVFVLPVAFNGNYSNYMTSEVCQSFCGGLVAWLSVRTWGGRGDGRGGEEGLKSGKNATYSSCVSLWFL